MSNENITAESLNKTRGVIDWVGRISRLESNQVDPAKLAQIEAKLNQYCELILKNNEAGQQTAIRNAEANERIASHFEETKRVWERVDEQDETLESLSLRLQSLEKSIIELRIQNQNLIEFTGGVRKAAWIGITCGGILLWWIVQRYLEHGAGMK